MPSGRSIRGVLANFLATYTSRYSDYDGYWLFGFLVGALGELEIDLLAPVPSPTDDPLSSARHSAPIKFLDQLRKARLEPSQLRDARLTIRELPGPVEGFVNGFSCSGRKVEFAAEAVLTGGRRHRVDQTLFVAAHNPATEHRSARAG